jgi:parallel beta-helix repeat protein
LIRKWFVIGIIFLLICTFSIPSFGKSIIEQKPNFILSNGNTLYVGGTGPGNYTKIQDAVENSTSGDTVFVYSNTYYECILLSNSISLVGENRENTILFPGDVWYNDNSTINISADNCSINGFTIRNNIFDIDVAGIFLHSSDNKIYNNNIRRFEYGIYLTEENEELYFTNNNISNNEISNCTFGIYTRGNFNFNSIYRNNIIDNYEGIKIYYSKNNSIIRNYCFSNTYYAMYLNVNSDGNIVSKNVCKNNRYAIRVKATTDNQIFLNWVENNEIGLYSCCGSNYNYFFSNSVIDNDRQASDAFSNYWDNGIIGNYWNDYNGTDSNGDGIGDTPYQIPDGENEDRYPLMEPFENNPPEKPSIDGPPQGKAGEEYRVIVHSADLDSDYVFYLVDWGDGTTSGWIGPFPQCVPIDFYHNFRMGTYCVRVKSKDIYGHESEWSNPLEVVIPRSRLIKNVWINYIFKQFPILKDLLYSLN